MTERDAGRRLETVGKLLAQATDVAGTPEADAFTDRAFALVAKWGVEQTSLSPVDGDITDVIVRHDVAVEGSFLQQRIVLLTRIASALHCASAYWLFSDTVSTVEIYGLRRHVDRIRVLYDPLLTRMLRQATASPWSRSTAQSPQEHQVSWMQGFTLSIRARLRSAESVAAARADEITGLYVQRQMLDAELAAAEKKRQLPNVRRSSYNPTIRRNSLAEGFRAGHGTEAPPNQYPRPGRNP